MFKIMDDIDLIMIHRISALLPQRRDTCVMYLYEGVRKDSVVVVVCICQILLESSRLIVERLYD